MKTGLGILALFCISVVTAEIVYLEDNNDDVHKRNFDLGLPETLQFNLRHSSDLVSLNLRENKRLNANAPIYEEVKDKYGNPRIQRNLNIAPNNKVRYYQDLANGAYMTVECMKRPGGPCARILTGNLFLKGREYKLEPALDELNRRELPSHLGTPHRMEALPIDTRVGGIKKAANGANVMEAVRGVGPDKFNDDFVVYEAETTTAPTTTEDYGETREEREHERRVANDFLMEKLLERLTRQKRQTPTAHGVEMLLAIDHVIYNEFATRYTGDENIKYKIREYYVHIINGVDVRYASIQENDMSVYVVISGFYISNDVSQSPWMNYGENPTNGGSGLSNMISWRTSSDLPNHDHACLITGTNIQNNGKGNVVGIAYLSGVCLGHRVSIQEEMGFFQGAGVLAHELGHNLGAYHDSGVAGSACDPESYYLMAPYVAYVYPGSDNTEPWQFSRCSIDEFRAFFNELSANGGDCTLSRVVIYDEDEYNKHTEGLAGQLYDVDEQCELLRGTGGSFCGTNENQADICRNLRCQSPGSSCSSYTAAHGTPCGNNLMCFRGICQQPINSTTNRPTGNPSPTQPPSPSPSTGGPTTAPVPCDETFTDETGVIQSPNYPNAYPNNRECAYVINRPAGERIRLTFSFFDVEGSGCQFDYLEIRNGDNENSPLLGIFCGPDMPSQIESSGNDMYLKFVTDGSVQNLGFKLNYESFSDNGPPKGYMCGNVGVGDYSCQDIRSLMGNAIKMCMKFFGQCCQYCYNKKGCKKDRPVKGASKYQCADLVTSLGLEQTCSMFPYECCKTCKDLATSRRR